MKNYTDKTDEEINIEVAELRGVNWWLPPSNSSSGGWEYCKVPYLMTKPDSKLPDYCSSWADAGPIAMESCIVITPCMGKLEGDATGYFEHENPITIDFASNDKALRAAMIVFLMMKDAEK